VRFALVENGEPDLYGLNLESITPKGTNRIIRMIDYAIKISQIIPLKPLFRKGISLI
jgi:hypothetical protein